MYKIKICTKCGEELPATTEYFAKNKMGKYGLYSICKICMNCKETCDENCKKYNKEYHENKLKITKTCTKCGKELPATIEYFHKNGKILKSDCKICNNIKRKTWHINNREYVIKENKKRYNKNKHIQYQMHKRWRTENKELANKYARELMAKKCKNDPKFKLNKNMRTAIWRSLKGNKKGQNWELIVGYTREQLIKHIELKFKLGMNWNNYGEWHIDHERPIASFNYTNIEDQGFKECWALDNLQPLWAIDNIRKGAKY